MSKVIRLRREISNAEAARILHQVSRAAHIDHMDKPKPTVKVQVTAGKVLGALCFLAVGYILVQIAMSALNGWLPSMPQHAQASIGGFIAGMLFMAGVVLAALAVFGVVRS